MSENGWIRVADCKPTDHEWVLTCSIHTGSYAGQCVHLWRYIADGFFKGWDDGEHGCHAPDYWMPLPAPPKPAPLKL